AKPDAKPAIAGACWMLAFAQELIKHGLSPGEGHLYPKVKQLSTDIVISRDNGS
nr:hypothetical protein [Tanacetum cinerariifolium]